MARKRSEPMTEADLAAVWADVAEGYRPEAEAAFEQIEAKHPYVFEEGADPADDCRVLVRVTWARLRDFYAVSDPTRIVVNEKAAATFAGAMEKAFVLGFRSGYVNAATGGIGGQ